MPLLPLDCIYESREDANKRITREVLTEVGVDSRCLKQFLILQQPPEPLTKPYLLYDNGGLFISFNTAQEAFAWIAFYTPAAITHVHINSTK